MPSKSIPDMFRILLSDMCISQSDIRKTSDSFFLVFKSLSAILAERNIFDFLDSKGERLPCDRFFDDWFLYAVPSESDHTYSLLKFREQEGYAFDAVVLDDSVLVHPQQLNLAERMERAVYLGLDEKNITAKFVAGEKIFV